MNSWEIETFRTRKRYSKPINGYIVAINVFRVCVTLSCYESSLSSVPFFHRKSSENLTSEILQENIEFNLVLEIYDNLVISLKSLLKEVLRRRLSDEEVFTYMGNFESKGISVEDTVGKLQEICTATLDFILYLEDSHKKRDS